MEDDIYTAKVNSVLKLNLVAKFVALVFYSTKPENRTMKRQVWVQRDLFLIMKSGTSVELYTRSISSTSRSSSKRYGHSPSDLMLETTQVPYTLTFGCVAFSKATYRIFTYWLSQCESDTLVNTSTILWFLFWTFLLQTGNIS